jgi:predicted lipoprotein with Yx(FWY)xxD motif
MGRLRIAAGALPLILILAACSSAATPTPVVPSIGATQAPASQPAASQPAASQPAAGDAGAGASGGTAESYDLKVDAGSGAATNYLSGEDGKSLYVFANDVASSGKSACAAGACLDSWPPFTVTSLDEVKENTGVSGKLALITRDDGTMQVTYNGKPLYYFAGDSAAGDTNGKAIPSWSLAHP